MDGTVRYSSGLDIGYRWYEAHGVRPLFPFGYGLSYTSFALSRVSLHWAGTGELARLTVTNTGRRSGTDIVQVYVSFPASAGEPPRQLAGFQPVTLAPRASRQVTVTLPLRSFEAFLGGHFRTVHGSYRLGFGSSSVDLPIWLTTTVPPASPRVPGWAELVIVLAVIGVLGTVGYRLGAKTGAARAARSATTVTGQARLPQ